jgi:hypothetical protein
MYACFLPRAKTGNTRPTISFRQSGLCPTDSGHWNFLPPDKLTRNRKIQRAAPRPSFVLPYPPGNLRRVWLRQEYEFNFFYIF